MTEVEDGRLGIDYMPLDARRIPRVPTYRIIQPVALHAMAMSGAASTLDAAICEHTPREYGVQWFDGFKNVFVTWAFDICTHGPEPVVITQDATESTEADLPRRIGVTPYQRGFLTRIESDEVFHNEMERLFLEWNRRLHYDFTLSSGWDVLIEPLRAEPHRPSLRNPTEGD